MGHSVQLVIGRGSAVEAFLRHWPMARAVALQGEWRAIPIDEALYVAISTQAADDPGDDAFDFQPPGFGAVMEQASRGGALAYVETDYFGGLGSQSGGAWIDGRAREAMRGHGAINSALAQIGVLRDGDKDAFDTIRLGERRSMDDYSPDGPVRLRAQTAREEPPSQTLPVWLVALLILCVVAIGIGVALL